MEKLKGYLAIISGELVLEKSKNDLDKIKSKGDFTYLEELLKKYSGKEVEIIIKEVEMKCPK